MNKIKILSIIFAGILTISGCSEDFFDINNDPNNPEEATLALTLPAPLSRIAFVSGGYYQTLGAFWAQQYAQSPAASQWGHLESYNLTEDDFNRQFTSLYAGALMDCQKIIDQSVREEEWGYHLIGTSLLAYTYQLLIDLYDQLPYSEAFLGEENLQPRYDNGEDIYIDLLERIDEALAKDLNARTITNPGRQDLIFEGDYSKWVSFAKTLKLKMYLRFVNKSPDKYASQIRALLEEGDFLTNDDAAFSAFRNEVNGYNPFYALHYYRLSGNVIASNTAINFLNNNADPRISKAYNASSSGQFVGIDQGGYQTAAGTNYQNYSQPNITSTYPVYFFTKEEVLFLVAEAEARYGSGTNAQVAYQAAINTSLQSFGITENYSYPYNGIESIITQKWVASINKRSIEAFFDYNRTGYPDIFVRSASSIYVGDEKPKRLFFPDSERQTNSNTPPRVELTEKVWWGK